MESIIAKVFGKKVGGARVVPLALKIVIFFVVFLIASNLMTNYINLTLNRGELIKLMTQLLVKELKELYIFASTQYDIYQYNNNLTGSQKFLEEKALSNLKFGKALFLGIEPDGSVFFQASKYDRVNRFSDTTALATLEALNVNENPEGSINFNFAGIEYIGVYKYHPQWNIFLIRAENYDEYTLSTWVIFRNISFWILGITLVCTVIGIFIISYLLRFLKVITKKIILMQETQDMTLIDLSKAPNDEITFLGISFNALAHTISNLLNIFRKFVTNDLVIKAYKEKEIRLEGSAKELTMLFSDIVGFTYMTETLGNDIITLLNIHYERAISHIHVHEGIIGSIIGDALLAVYGAYDTDSSRRNKSYDSLLSAYELHEMAQSLRCEMQVRKNYLMKKSGSLTEFEERVYKAVLLDIGVGIDGGLVFYGNIGSYERMANTVIGDNVNSASRLEGLTRFYKVPVICSEYVKNEVETMHPHNGNDFQFIELDRVQVKGKIEGKTIYWPVPSRELTPRIEADIDTFQAGLKHYYNGDWVKAYKKFATCSLAMAEVFKERTKSGKSPRDWNGIWTMASK